MDKDPTSLVVPRLGTTNDGSETASPAEAKIITGGPHTRRGWGCSAAAFTLMSVLTPVCPTWTAVGQSAAGHLLEGSLGGLILVPLITVGDVTIVEHFVK